MGLTRHQVYLGFWGVNANLFPKATDWLLLHGYYGLIDRFVAVFNALMGNIAWSIAAAIFLAFAVFLVDLFNRLEFPQIPAKLVQGEGWLRRLLLLMLFALLVFVSLPGTLLVLTAFSAVPAALGETAGRSAAEAVLIEYKKGCVESRHHCVQLRNNGAEVAKGFVLDDSQAHIAIFDVDLQRSRTLPREGLEVISLKEPGLRINGK